MTKKKKHRGNYCKICDRIITNERFSGKGHSNHVCKECSKLPLDEQNEKIELNRIYGLYRYWNLSKANKKMLQNCFSSKYKKVRIAAKEMFDEYCYRTGYLSVTWTR